ncbi:hypothetical protein OVA24_03245 [Luteolibacter sp. SL250]|uniref:hypothetical protein n=1 Tax=Luteolibacter sp. SL250 TaxID=2995170 RepID=UPI00226DDF77|nr:hypothetical protein [Luteolibacter sp. SL250]WAC20393.1 hypothetical protein OVA24_03245 [Luteolibacter sp. SL250]
MNISRPLLLVSGTLISLIAHGVAVLGEAARNAEGLGFSERFGIGRLAAGLGKLTFRQLKDIQFEVWEFLSFGGMVAVMAAALAGMDRGSRWLPVGYLSLLVVLGGWKALLMVFYAPIFLFKLVFEPLPMDGEFFADSTARYMGAGVWLLVLSVWALSGFIKWRPKWLMPPRVRHII